MEFRGDNHLDFFQNDVVNAALYSERLDDNEYAVLAARYAALINWKHGLLLHDNAPVAHTAALIKAKVKGLPGSKSNFFLIQHMLALILGHHPTITCSAPWLTLFAATGL